jgi:hypothetical protein
MSCFFLRGISTLVFQSECSCRVEVFAMEDDTEPDEIVIERP